MCQHCDDDGKSARVLYEELKELSLLYYNLSRGEILPHTNSMIKFEALEKRILKKLVENL